MKMFRIFLVFGVFVSLAEFGFSQSDSPRIAIVNQVDTAVTHVYVDPWQHNLQTKKDVFNYGAYSVKELVSKFNGSSIDAVEMNTPIWFHKMVYMNVIGKPSKQFKAWLTTLKQQENIDYLIVMVHKWNPDPEINYKFLDGRHYGIASYATNTHAITLFSLVGYYIFSTETFKEIKLNPNHDRYVITNLSLLETLSFKETNDLPPSYYKLTKDKLRNVADTRNAEIWRVMLKEIEE